MFREYLLKNSLDELLCAPGAYNPFPHVEDRNAWENLSADVQKLLLSWGEEALLGYPQLTATQFLAYSRTGNRKVFETPYFARRTLLFGAVLAECVENQGRFVDAIVDGLWAICEESSWVISAHNNSIPDDMHPFMTNILPDTAREHIDLFAAQTASVLAFSLYFMRRKLDDITPLICTRVRREIDRRILTPLLNHTDFWWMGYGSKTVNNWNPWIVSNVMDTALLLENDPVRRKEELTRLMIILDRYLEVVPQDGGCDEGAGYFNVAGASLLDCLESLYCASNGKISFYHEPHIAAIGSYPAKVHIAGPYYLNFADCDGKPMLDYERLFTYGMRTNNLQLRDLGAAMYAASSLEERLLIRDTPQVNRVLYSLFSGLGAHVPEPPAAPFMQMPDLQVFAWQKNGLYAAIKGGHNDESHNHNDVGSFVVYTDGEPEIIDMGNMVYTAATFGPNRYQIKNTRSQNHNVPLVNGIEQQAGKQFAARNIEVDEHGIRMEIGSAYPEHAHILSLQRSMRMTEEGYTLSDQINLQEALPVSWVFMLRNQPVVDSAAATFGKLKLAFHPELTAAIEEMPVDDDRMKRSFDGSLWRLTLTAASSEYNQFDFMIGRA